jgi:hypothetical protein
MIEPGPEYVNRWHVRVVEWMLRSGLTLWDRLALVLPWY